MLFSDRIHFLFTMQLGLDLKSPIHYSYGDIREATARNTAIRVELELEKLDLKTDFFI